MRVKSSPLLAPVAVVMLALCGQARAQSVYERNSLNDATDIHSNFQRDRNTAVAERQQPGYEPLGLRTRSFMILPKIGLGAQYNDNVLANPANTRGDAAYEVTPEVDATSTWSRHFLQAYLRGDLTRYSRLTTENTDNYMVGGVGRFDLGLKDEVDGTFDYSHSTEGRAAATSSLLDLKSPIRFNVLSAHLSGVHELNRVRMTLGADLRKYDYSDAVSVSGAPLPESDRNRSIATAMLRVDYAVSPAVAVFVEGNVNQRDYRLKNPPPGLFPNFHNRSSNGVEALAGANFDITRMTRGEIAFGYLRQSFNDAAFPTISGLSTRTRLLWFPTQLMTVTFTATRTLEDSGLVGSAGSVASNVGVKVDHELLRNLILSAGVAIQDQKYRGLDRTDNAVYASAGATYLMNHHMALNVGYKYDKLNSKGLARGPDLRINRIGATLTIQY